MIAKFELLSVKEDDGQSDRLTAGAYTIDRYNLQRRTKFSVFNHGHVVINQRSNRGDGQPNVVEIQLGETDIDSLIEFLKEAKQFIREQELVDALMGVK